MDETKKQEGGQWLADEAQVVEHLAKLRMDYANANSRQRVSVIHDRLADDMPGPNRVITLVSAIEALARCLVLWHHARGRKVRPWDIYEEFKLRSVESLVGEVCRVRRSASPEEIFGRLNWGLFMEATEYRDLLVHECTYLNWRKLSEVTGACEAVLHVLPTEGLRERLGPSWRDTESGTGQNR